MEPITQGTLLWMTSRFRKAIVVSILLYFHGEFLFVSKLFVPPLSIFILCDIDLGTRFKHNFFNKTVKFKRNQEKPPAL